MGKLVRGAVPLKSVAAVGLALGAAAAPVAVVTGPASAKTAAVGSFDSEIAAFYRARGGAPLWLAPGNGTAAPQLIQLLASAQADGLNPRRYNVRALGSAVAQAQTGNPAAIQRAEVLLSQAFVTYVRDVRHDPGIGIIYVDEELKPTAPSAGELLSAASHAPVSYTHLTLPTTSRV